MRVVLLTCSVAAVLLFHPFTASSAQTLDLDPCNNTGAPIPASPYGDGAWGVKLNNVATDADPFNNPETVTLESVYGTTPAWVTYDNGCTGQFMAGAGTALGNIMLQISGLLPNWSHLLLATTVSPESPLRALENPVVEATAAVTDGVWKPWVSITLLIVAVVVLTRARDGHLARSFHAAAWAGLVLLITTWLITYPAESVDLVDDGVRGMVTTIATGFADHPGPEGTDPAVAAVAGQMDDVVRATQYRSWVSGTFGDTESETAKAYGPDLFRATHFSFTEYDTYRDDPQGEGKKILDAKQEAFKKIAEQVEHEDPRAYEYLTGEHWNQRVTTSLINLIVVFATCGFLLAAGLAILLSFVLIRLLVPFAPAAGTLFMIDHTRDLAVSWLHRIVGPLVMGPVLFLTSLILLRIYSAILNEPTVWFVLQIAIITTLTLAATWAVKPAAYGIGDLRTAVATTWGLATGWRRPITPYTRPVDERPLTGSPPSPPSKTVSGTVHQERPALPPAGSPTRAFSPASRRAEESDTSAPGEAAALHRRPSADTYDPNRGEAYASGDARRPGAFPAYLPASTYKKGDTEPGWSPINRGPWKPWMGYQEQVTGVQRTSDGHIPEYHVYNSETGKPVRFDGHVERGKREVFLDAKRGYRLIVFKPELPKSQSMLDKLIDEAGRQLDVLPEEAALEWHFADPYVANKVRRILAQNDLEDIHVIYTPKA
ncbi:Tox-REase-5 domain-containing protein [Nocardioides sp. NPDC051685]|uniref:Tox-REase-5 domain-containing protein n=1 Tax=Nocardioides sp. NPDC051685 TaxID=3364334 RepID=UPI0037959F4A